MMVRAAYRHASEYRVCLNGDVVHDWVAADTENGTVEFIMRDDEGRVASHNGMVLLTRRSGDVTIELEGNGG